MSDLRDALDDAIVSAYARPLAAHREGEDERTVRALARAALFSDPDRMRHCSDISKSAWEVVRGAFAAWSECETCGTGWRLMDHDHCPVCTPPEGNLPHLITDEMVERAARAWEPETFELPVDDATAQDARADAARALAAAFSTSGPQT